ncbi:MAG: murein biosynthesis integral membrane protein MurJ [Alphaproteobacteria bacterium]|nr:murein biosynthesis integral membrane protein MurJ [Alphaproteobacteria bacterium]
MSFFKSVVTVGGLTLGSRILGFIRDILTAAVLGAGPIADAFFVALKLPNFFRRITAEGAFSVSFVPMFSGMLAEGGEEGRREAVKFAQEAQAVMLAVLIPFTALMLLLMPWVLHVIAPGFGSTPQRYDLALEMSRVTFPYILLMSLTALLGGVMNSFDRFGPFAAAPMLFNLALIFAMFCFTPFTDTAGHALAWGVMLAGVLQLAWLFYATRRLGIMLKWQRPRLTPHIRKLFRKMGPGVFGAGIAQINLFIDMVLASLLPVGAISYLYYADRLYQLPLSVIGIAIGTALLPMLARALKAEEPETAKRLFNKGIEISLLLALPATVAFLVIGDTIVNVLFVRGAFGENDGLQAGYVLMAYTLGLPAFIVSRVFSTVFFAHGDTATPVKYAVVCAVMNTLLAIALLQYFQHVGIALATGLTAWVNLVLLMRGLRKRKMASFAERSVKRTLTIFGASLAMGVVIFAQEYWLMPYFMDRGEVWRLSALAGLVFSGAGVYGGILYVSGILTRQMVKDLFPKRKKQDTIEDVQQFGQ